MVMGLGLMPTWMGAEESLARAPGRVSHVADGKAAHAASLEGWAYMDHPCIYALHGTLSPKP